jgi:diguanylate cyclase (GGDEF)-like protein
MNVDTRTLFLVLGIADVLQVIVFFLLYLVNRAYKGIGWWVLGSALSAAGLGLMLLQDVVSVERISSFSSGALLVLGQVFLYIGVMRFLDKKENRVIAISVFAVFSVFLFYYSYINNDIAARTVIVSAATAAVSLLTADRLFVNKLRTMAASANFTAAVLFLYGCYFMVRAVLTLISSPANSFFAPALSQTAVLLVSFSEGILLTFGFIIMINQRLVGRLSQLAVTDELTGIYNRRVFMEMADREMARFLRYHTVFSFIKIDLDRFKLINEQHGRMLGDRVLKELAGTLSMRVRKVDIVGRLSSEKFGVVLPETGESGARQAALRFHAALKQLDIRSDSGEQVKLKISMGVSAVTEGDSSLDMLIARADAALNMAQQHGRDRVETA